MYRVRSKNIKEKIKNQNRDGDGEVFLLSKSQIPDQTSRFYHNICSFSFLPSPFATYYLYFILTEIIVLTNIPKII
jgi:hypothetical protein